mmetsp:Transcript_106864/g.297545  ORF Transcript_106864/g.297545 Transcript_106864/m.297545 type:complete len:375 (+) Transcript_106864:2-1126(+)
MEPFWLKLVLGGPAAADGHWRWLPAACMGCAFCRRRGDDGCVEEMDAGTSGAGVGSTASTAPPPAVASSALCDESSIGSPRPDDAALTPRPLTEEERQAAWRAANFHAATSGHLRPVALWIVGPSSVGKSTLTAELSTAFAIPRLHGEVANEAEDANSPLQPSVEPILSNQDVRSQLNAVIIDGEFMRDAHPVWQRWVRTDDWRSAYPALKATINKEKDRLEDAAIAQRKHLIIPQTMLNLGKGLADVARLAGKGYTNHVLAVVAPLEECQRRGRAREVETGKRYQPLEFVRSVEAIPPVVAACNGRYQLVRAEEEGSGSRCRLGHRLLAAGPCGASCQPGEALPGELNAPAPGFDAEELLRAITECIGRIDCT